MAHVIADRVSERYGPIGFTAATLNVFLGSLAAWMSFPYYLLYVYFVPIILVDLVAAAILARCTGTLGQAGRGMLIGLLSVPLSPAVIWTSLLLGPWQ
jgi:hypothetical protein